MIRRPMLAVLGLVASLWTMGPRPARAALKPVVGGTAVLLAEGPLASSDPVLARSPAERLVAEAVHCPVTDLLAAPPEPSADRRRWTLRLRQDLVFHDGSRLTAEDAARSLHRVTDPRLGAPEAWRLLGVLGVAERLAGEPVVPALRAVDAHTLVLDLARPDPDLPARLADPRLAVVARDGRSGCGPFRVRSRRRQEVVLVPFDRHPAGRPYLDRLTVRLPGGTGEPADGALGRLATEGLSRPGGGTATFLRVRHPLGVGLARALAPVIDPPSLARFLAVPGAAPFDPASAAAPSTTPALPSPLSLAFDPASPTHRAVAERIQLQLHDRGVSLRLVPGGVADLSLVTLPLAAGPQGEVGAVFQLLGPAAARAAWAADRDGVPWDTLPVVPLYREAGRVRLGPALMGGGDGRVVPVDPAGLWRWPLPSPPAARP